MNFKIGRLLDDVSERPANRRKVKGILVDSRAQLRLFIAFFVLLVLNSATLVLTYLASIQFANPSDANSPNQLVLYEAVNLVSEHALTVGLWGFVLSATLTLLFWLMLSHRIFGPMVPILRQIDRLANGDYEARINLRRFDEFKDVAQRLNVLAEKLAEQKEIE